MYENNNSKPTSDSAVGVGCVVRQKPKTSEELLQFTKQPEETCPEINRAIVKIKDAQKEIKWTRNEYDIERLRSAITDIEWDIDGLENSFEYCRSQCQELRAWGQDWKDLCKKLIDKYEPERLEEDEGLSA